MATLSAAQRKRLPRRDFAVAGGKFPIPDKAHAKAAEARKGQAKPPLSAAQKHAIDVKSAKYGVGPLAKKIKRRPR